MQISKTQLTPTTIKLTITADKALLLANKSQVLAGLAKDVKIDGFRKGHAPQHMIEKAIDPNTMQSKFLDTVLQSMYGAALMQEQLRPVTHPKAEITKFVPYSDLEVVFTVEVVGDIKLADYKKFRLSKEVPATSDADVQAVVDDLLARDATKSPVTRPTKDGDEVVIDFTGTDPKSHDVIVGASGQDYPLVVGSNTFIPGFEPELVGLKAGNAKTFTVTFPGDYGAAALQNKKVTFDVSVKEVREVIKPKLTDESAGKEGPFKTVAELKADIRKQIAAERDSQAQRKLESDLLQMLAEKSEAHIPEALIEEEIERMEAEEKRNLVYRGQTWQEHLEAEGKTEAEHHEAQRGQASLRVKSGLVLGDVAQTEGVTVTPTELDERIADLKKQYTDAQMQAELAKPENRQEIMSRLLTEKTLTRLVEYASK